MPPDSSGDCRARRGATRRFACPHSPLGTIGATGALLAIANFDPERCTAAFEGDVDAQRSLIKPHLETMVRLTCLLKEFVAARFATTSTTRVGRNRS